MGNKNHDKRGRFARTYPSVTNPARMPLNSPHSHSEPLSTPPALTDTYSVFRRLTDAARQRQEAYEYMREFFDDIEVVHPVAVVVLDELAALRRVSSQDAEYYLIELADIICYYNDHELRQAAKHLWLDYFRVMNEGVDEDGITVIMGLHPSPSDYANRYLRYFNGDPKYTLISD